ncbi:MAG: hypothetical protein ACHQQR_16680, partial [Gemmatimonadales bacterium]
MALPSLVERLSDLPAFTRLLATLPAGAGLQRVSGLAGSADAVLVAALAAHAPNRMLTVVADQLPEAERWLADLQSVAGEQFVALYPPREGFGEVEPHAEVAGERVETLERMTRGEVRVLLTTARAVLERTRLPRALASARLELRKGDSWRLDALAAHLETVGFERVEMVEDVAQFAVRGGIVDVYGFGMSEPMRLEFLGDEIVELRYFDLLTQRTSKPAELALVLPVDVSGGSEAEERFERTTLASLLPPGTLVVVPRGVHLEPEMRRTWDEAAHHIDLARRRGEDAAPRDELYQPPGEAAAALRGFPQLEIVESAAEEAVVFPLRAPETIDRDMSRLAALVRGDTPTIILCDNAGQAERLDELLATRPGLTNPSPSPAALAIGVLGGGFVIPASGSMAGLRVLTDHEIFRR